MTLRKLVGVVPVIAALSLAAPVASASTQTARVPGPESTIPCYPYPAFCGPGGQPWLSFFLPSQPLAPTGPVQFGPGPVQFGPGPVQFPTG